MKKKIFIAEVLILLVCVAPAFSGYALFSQKKIQDEAQQNSTKLREQSRAETVHDVPDLISAVGDGNLHFADKRQGSAWAIYSYGCSEGKYNNYLAKYQQKLNSFKEIKHFVNNNVNNSGLRLELWAYDYTGSKRVQKCRFNASKLYDNNKFQDIDTNLVLFGVVDRTGQSSIVIAVSNGLTYGVNNDNGKKSASASSKKSSLSKSTTAQSKPKGQSVASATPKFNGLGDETASRPAQKTSVPRQAKAASNNSGYDVPDFFATVNDGNLRYMRTEHGTRSKTNTNYTSYSFECDTGKYNNYIERYVQQLGGYPLRFYDVEKHDYRRVIDADMIYYEEWKFTYTGSKQVNDLRILPKHKYDGHVHVTKTAYRSENGITHILLTITDGLTYDNRSTANMKASLSRGSSGSSYSSSSSSSGSSMEGFRESCSRCHTTGKVDCKACNGRGGREEYTHSPNYSGSTRGSSTRTTWKSCSSCFGRGKVDCPDCGGRGYIQH